MSKQPPIELKGVKVHNLKSVDLTLEHGKLIVFTGVSGSGKSSLAFDTIYVEGQRRYVESLSTYARRHFSDLVKPDAEVISGISPTIAIEQKTAGRNPRSTVGTMTGIYDFLRVLFARIATPYCPVSGEPVSPLSSAQILDRIKDQFAEEQITVLSPYAKNKKGEFKDDFEELMRKGFLRVRIDGKITPLGEDLSLDGKIAHDVDIVIDRITVSEKENKRLEESVTLALEVGNGVIKVLGKEELLFSQTAFSFKSGLSYEPLEPSDFSFNHPSGMCLTCQGLGTTQEFDLSKVINPKLSIAEDCCLVASSYKTVRYGNIYDNLAKLYHFKVTTPWEKLSTEAKEVFLHGINKKWVKMQFVHPEKKTKWTDYIHWKGVLGEAKERFQKAESEAYQKNMKALMHESECSACKGTRLKPYPSAAQLGGKTLGEISAFSTEEAYHFFKNLKLSKEQTIIAEELIKEIVERLFFLKNVGLHYLSLDRTAPTLSGGEAQRVRLASQIGSGLVGATYVLDEPSIGLHARDNLHLLKTLEHLKNLGNTVIVVEHDLETILAADWIVDVGPFAGRLGGKVLCSGSLQDLLSCEESVTSAYVSGRKKIPIPEKKKPKTFLTLTKAEHHNLKEVTLKLPLGLFVAITGVSGSGKSSLITDTLYPALCNHLHASLLPVGKYGKIEGVDQIDKVIAIDQTPIGRTPRSNPATYIKLFDEIRDLFSSLPESIAHGYKPGRFSFNVKEGSCPHCSGMGMITIDMDFMEDAWVTCEYCQGKRFDSTTLSVLYKGKTIADILEMTVDEGVLFFEPIPSIHRKLLTLQKVGLGYIQIGQPSPTLSGGEAQRIKLAKELARKDTGKTLYILDEPTTGLHFHDISHLLTVLRELVSFGNSVVVIEHNTDLIKTADWVIDLGPEGGKEGGKIIAEDTPENISKKSTPTGEALRAAFKEHLLLKPPVHEQKEPLTHITVRGAQENTLKKVSAEIPLGKITICTGPSGSGKSSFAFDTVYAEGQRRYVESLSPYARQFIKQSPKPKVDEITGLSPAIAIEQKNHSGNPRSTIGTLTETYDFLRVLYAHLGTPHSPQTGERIETISQDVVVKKVMQLEEKTKIQILSPVILKKGETFAQTQERLQKLGFLKVRLNGTYYELEEEIPFDPQRKNSLFLVIDRLIVGATIEKRLKSAIEQATTLSKGTLVVDTEKEDLFFNLAFAVLSTGESYPPITPHTFSFNTESGMCPECLGLGFQYGAHLETEPTLLKYSPYQILLYLWKNKASEEALSLAVFCLEKEGLDTDLALKKLSPAQKNLFFQGSSEFHKKNGLFFRWIGLNPLFTHLSRSKDRDIKEALLPLFGKSTCPSCDGMRLGPLARHVTIENISIGKLCRLSISETLEFLQKITLSSQTAFLQETLDQLLCRLHFLEEIGLGYLSLERSAPTLSGGEAQRIRLARQLGANLTGTLYVLDEPTIGLHPQDITKLNTALKKLSSLGNTLLLVEHDPLTLPLADKVIDFGPKAGREGGEIVASGTLQEILNNPNSLTGAFLSGKIHAPRPSKRKKAEEFLTLKNATLHNITSLDISFPLNTLTCVTGVSGSGKSTLIGDLLQPALQSALAGRTPHDPHLFQGAELTGTKNLTQVLILDQNPIGHTNRADISTYVDLLTSLRYFFASLPDAKVRGLAPKHFSFNHLKGMCTECQGLGVKHISLQFLPPVEVVCPSCKGFRFNPLSLQVHFKGKHLGHILKMTVQEALEFLPPIPKVVRILHTLISVGLEYLTLSQEIATLSGGEAQRLRLSCELSKRQKGHTLYLFDEPSVGLHPSDIAKLLPIFHTLVTQGHSVLLIEHNLDIIASADHIIDMGPGPGKHGGKIVAQGTPEEVAKTSESPTGRFLKSMI